MEEQEQDLVIQDPPSDEQLIERTTDGRIVGGIAIWHDINGRFLGCLLDERFQQVASSTTWGPGTLRQTLESLDRAAHNYRVVRERER